jgi:ferritin-like metal-binding protein YciE
MEQKSENELYIYTDEKIEKVKAEVSDVIKSILAQGQKIDQLTERINEGVSKTAFKTWEKVNEISVSITELKTSNEVRDGKLHTVASQVEWIIRGIFIVVFAALVLSLWKLK